MSHPLNSFSVSDEKNMHHATDFDGPSTFFNEDPQHTDTNFLAHQPEVPESFLNLEGHSRSVVSPGLEAVHGEQVLLNSSEEGIRDEVSSAPLLCLDPSTGLHVLVHNICQTIQQPTEQQVDVAPEQFVVVWALQSEEEPVVLEKSIENAERKTSTFSEPAGVGDILHSPVMPLETNTVKNDSVVQQILSSSVEPTLDVEMEIPSSKNLESNHASCRGDSLHINIQDEGSQNVEEKIQHGNTATISCPDASMLTLQVAEEGKSNSPRPETQPDILLETVPHISLEEIIEKFTCESNHALHVLENEKLGSLNIPKKDECIETTRKEPSTLQDNSMSSQSFHSVLADERSNVNSKSNVIVKVKTSLNILEESMDEESFYDILMTYKCKLCSEVFIDKARLMKHYNEMHKSRKGVKIFVTSKSNGSLSSSRSDSFYTSKQETLSTLNSNSNSQKHKDLSLMTCRHCFRTFLGMQELQLHISHEHPTEVKKETKKKKSEIMLRLPTQPGLLFGHNEARVSVQEDTDDKKKESQKRRIRAPKNLDEQYWLQKQRLKPVLAVVKEKVFKCSIDHCRFRFSSEENVKIHEKCHRNHGKGEEKVYFCCKCSGKFLKWGMCQMHLWKVHGMDIDLLTCGICLAFKTDVEQKLLVHQKIHSDVREYTCKVCNKAFHQHSQLLNHEVLHISNANALPQWHQKAFCTTCKKWFSDRQTLKKHMNNVHLKVKRHSCPHCPYKCTRKYDLRIHIRKHTQEKPHQCEFCGHWYRDANTLRRHKWIHFLIKPFKCPRVTCQYESSRLPHFKKHINKYHPKHILLYKCQTCSLEITDLQKYVRHVSLHEDQLFKEAIEKRANSAALPGSSSAKLDDVSVKLPLQSTVSGDGTNLNSIRIADEDGGNHMENVSFNSIHAGHTLTDDKQNAFMFEASGVQSVDAHNPESLNNHSGNHNLSVKLPSTMSKAMDGTLIKSQTINEGLISKINLIKEGAINTLTDISSDAFVFESVDNVREVTAQAFTISVDNMESTESFLKRTDTCNLVSFNLQKPEHPQETSFDNIKEDIQESSPHDSSVLNVISKAHHMESKKLSNRRQDNVVLNVIENTERNSIPGIGGENSALMTLSQVMSDDGHQYIIGISPEEIVTSQENIFAIGQNNQ